MEHTGVTPAVALTEPDLGRAGGDLFLYRASDVAEELERVVEREAPRFVAIGGDVRAVQLLKDVLPARILELVHDIDGQRTPDGSVNHVADDITRLVATAVASDKSG